MATMLYHPGRIAARLVMNLPESVRQTLGTLRQWPMCPSQNRLPTGNPWVTLESDGLSIYRLVASSNMFHLNMPELPFWGPVSKQNHSFQTFGN